MNDIEKNNKCPICKQEGIRVDKITVKHLIKEEHKGSIDNINEENYHICMNENCDVVYYGSDGTTLMKDQIKVPIWFKKDADPKYACYCNKVTEQQVIEAVRKHGAKTVLEVKNITGAMKDSNCKKNNPLGVCCHKIIQEAIDKGLK